MDTSRVVVPTWLRGSSLSQLFHGIGSWFSNLGEIACYALVIAGVVAFVYFYAKALAAVKAGRLVVYRDWGDFGRSLFGPVLLLVGLCLWCNDSSSVFQLLALVAFYYGVRFSFGLLAGAFRYNSGSRAWLALFARLAVLVLMFFALAKLNERFANYRRGRYGYGIVGVIRGVILPLMIFTWVFREFVRPMVGLQYYYARLQR